MKISHANPLWSSVESVVREGPDGVTGVPFTPSMRIDRVEPSHLMMAVCHAECVRSSAASPFVPASSFTSNLRVAFTPAVYDEYRETNAKSVPPGKGGYTLSIVLPFWFGTRRRTAIEKTPLVTNGVLHHIRLTSGVELN